jgi:hypothetical protein
MDVACRTSSSSFAEASGGIDVWSNEKRTLSSDSVTVHRSLPRIPGHVGPVHGRVADLDGALGGPANGGDLLVRILGNLGDPPLVGLDPALDARDPGVGLGDVSLVHLLADAPGRGDQGDRDENGHHDSCSFTHLLAPPVPSTGSSRVL